jgi:hypothetical protein
MMSRVSPAGTETVIEYPPEALVVSVMKGELPPVVGSEMATVAPAIGSPLPLSVIVPSIVADWPKVGPAQARHRKANTAIGGQWSGFRCRMGSPGHLWQLMSIGRNRGSLPSTLYAIRDIFMPPLNCHPVALSLDKMGGGRLARLAELERME